ncbi:hypothetical protein ACFWR6_07165 [Streptomyces griseus]|uniref:hypothetical protein n=1 Tax=Streptomyces griseus TaxID=1911 RepID=UPI003667DE92
MRERERIAQSVVGGLLVAAVVGALMVGCSNPDDERPCERYDRVGLSAAAGPVPAPRPPAPRPPAPRPPAPAPVQKVPSLQKQPAAPAPAPNRRGPRAAVPDAPDAPDAPGPATQQTWSPSPSPSETHKRRHLDLCDD